MSLSHKQTYHLITSLDLSWNEFCCWIDGQTTQLDEFYIHDIARFIREKMLSIY